MQADLAGRVVVVTGGAGGIGSGVAAALADAGARVAVLDRDTAAAPHAALTVAVDLTDEPAVAAAFARVRDELGVPWACVNAAGVAPAGDLVDLALADWRAVLAVNLDATFLCTREAARLMIAGGGGGRIVNLGSQLGLKGGERLAHYSASKAAVHGFGRAAARELAPHGITVNAVAPGPVETPMTLDRPAAVLDAQRAGIPLGRFATVAEVVPSVLLLIAPVGGAYITGAVLNVSGGDVMMD